LLLDRDAEIKQLEEAAQTHGEDEEKVRSITNV
jgi:hypothetical protein